MSTIAPVHATVRRLARDDLDAVVAIDARLEGRSRRGYFERRLAAALRDPDLHLQVALDDGDGLAGYMLGRVMEGEFGRVAPGLRLETIGVRPDAKGRNVGGRMLDALAQAARSRGIVELRTAARWNDHAMLRWLDEHGFTLAPNHVVERAIGATATDAPAGGSVMVDARREIDYGANGANDFERAGRGGCEVRSMALADLPEIARIDRELTGRDRKESIARKLAEAMHESGVRVSLVARLDDAIVGFAMARADLGDFGRTAPTAVLDTIGVDPEYAHRGIGHVLVAELALNCAALCIERLETVVAPRDLALLGFLVDVGFAPSQRLPFVRTLR
jgi:ribosomal protein S18 acetylase RimI-like enzyme